MILPSKAKTTYVDMVIYQLPLRFFAFVAALKVNKLVDTIVR